MSITYAKSRFESAEAEPVDDPVIADVVLDTRKDISRIDTFFARWITPAMDAGRDLGINLIKAGGHALNTIAAGIGEATGQVARVVGTFEAAMDEANRKYDEAKNGSSNRIPPIRTQPPESHLPDTPATNYTMN